MGADGADDAYDAYDAYDAGGAHDVGDADQGRELLARAGLVHVTAGSRARAGDAPAAFFVQASRKGERLLLRAPRCAAQRDRLRDGFGIGHAAVAAAVEVIASLPDEGVVLSRSARADAVLEACHDEPPFVAALSLDRVTYRVDLGQDLAPSVRLRVVEQLWQRGSRGDVDAAAQVLARSPDLDAPSFLRLDPDLHAKGVRLQCGLASAELDEVLDLLGGAYWLTGVPRPKLRDALRASTALVAARDANGRIVAFARAVSDDARCAWIYDVIVAAHLRGSRVGSAVMHVLLDHPAVRGVRHVRLTTRDAMEFYRRLGFSDLAEAPRHPWISTDMVRTRAVY
jgi:ribosomal protein S18 acetylase RimI-like enzyme